MHARTLAMGLALFTLPGCLDADPAAIVCDDDGSCWAHTSDWQDWAMHADSFEADLDDAGCWRIDGTDAHMCEVELDGVTLVGRPVAEMLMEPSACSDGPAWESATAQGECWAIIGGVAVALDLDR